MKPLHVICVLLLLGLSLPCMLLARTSSTRKSNAEPAVAMSCGDRYNSLLKSAKAIDQGRSDRGRRRSTQGERMFYKLPSSAGTLATGTGVGA